MTPVFVLAGPDGVVLADGPARGFADLASARSALSRHEVPILLGALPFDLSEPTALMSPDRVTFGAALPPWSRVELPPVQVEAMLPAPEVHRLPSAPGRPIV